jgi:hypothetical protein
VNNSLIDYAQGLLEALRNVNQVVEEGAGKSSLLDLLKGGFSLDERFDSGQLDKAAQLNSRLLDVLQNLRNPYLDSAKRTDACVMGSAKLHVQSSEVPRCSRNANCLERSAATFVRWQKPY